jgi:phage regulator Rha-like protein
VKEKAAAYRQYKTGAVPIIPPLFHLINCSGICSFDIAICDVKTWQLIRDRGNNDMTKKILPYNVSQVQAMIVTVRGQRVILATDLAELYGVQTKALNQAVKRNIDRFPTDFLFQLTWDESEQRYYSRSQFVTLKRGKNIKYLPYAFTEHGAIMAANVLNSPKAIEMSVFVVRAFIKMRETLANNKALALKLAELEKKLTERLNVHERAIVHVLGEIRKLMASAELSPEPSKRKIGFEVKEKAGEYKAKRRGLK